MSYQDALDAHRATFVGIEQLGPQIDAAASLIASTLRRGGKVMVCGNGGSAADAQHFAAELVGRFQVERQALAAISLTADTAALTAIANDYGFGHVFRRQVQGIGREGDCLIGISTSGNSENVLLAMAFARASCIGTIGLLGRDGGNIAPHCDQAIIVPAHNTARIQEAHGFILHYLCERIDA
jgi:D-sedoheptulose 7-phosphate isomerase